MLEPITITVPTHWQQSKTKRVFLGLNWFRNAYRFTQAKAKTDMHELVTKELEGLTPPEPHKGNYRLTLVYNYESTVSDLDNVVVVNKFVGDSLQSLGFVVNDNVKHCIEVRFLVGDKQVKGEGNCVITIDFLD